MPLRAKITNPQMTSQRSASTGPAIDSLPDDTPDDVTFASKYGVRTIQLNRPDKLNSLNGSMARKIIPRLQEWQKSGLANVIVIKGAGRAFCAGGDVAVLAQDCATGAEGQQRSKDYFALEYKLDHLIATYQKPYVAFIDGITMGGGVGLSVHAPIRIATEKTVFAMPETTIGFFPDVGASFFLPRMDGGLGMYLALTSERLSGPQVYFAGIATHYIHSTSLPDVEARLAELRFEDHTLLKNRIETIDRTIEEFSTGLPHDKPLYLDPLIRDQIDYVFGDPNVDLLGIIETLENIEQDDTQPQKVREWAAKTRATIQERSPQSVAVTFRMLRRGKDWNIAEAFRQEYRIASRFMEHPDFVTGVTARLITKQKGRPAWNPATINDLKETATEDFFKPKTGEQDLQLINQDSELQYSDYPYARDIGLPREADIREALRTLRHKGRLEQRAEQTEVWNKEKEMAKKQSRQPNKDLEPGKQPERFEEVKKYVLDKYVAHYGGKAGVKEKVEEVLGRVLIEEARDAGSGDPL